jgi:hypothetical protein
VFPLLSCKLLCKLKPNANGNNCSVVYGINLDMWKKERKLKLSLSLLLSFWLNKIAVVTSYFYLLTLTSMYGIRWEGCCGSLLDKITYCSAFPSSLFDVFRCVSNSQQEEMCLIGYWIQRIHSSSLLCFPY